MSHLLPDPTLDLHWGNYRGAIHEIFTRNTRSHPDRICVIETSSHPSGPKRSFTYQQIDSSTNQLARHFLSRGCEVGDVVMIYAHRGVDLVVAYLGALKAGATVSVLDPQYPLERQKILLDVAQPKFLMSIRRANQQSGKLSNAILDFIATKLSIKATVPELELSDDGVLKGGIVDGVDCLGSQSSKDEEPLAVLVGPDSIPTLSFTSGSEGRPKGVQGRHFSLTYYLPWMADKFDLSEKDKFCMLSGIAHDPIQRDIFTPLFLGAQLLIPPSEVINYEMLAKWTKDNDITVTHLTPAMGQILVGDGNTPLPSLRNAFFVGDILTNKECRRLQNLAPQSTIINLYGSTESQRAVSYFAIPSKTQEPQFLNQVPDVIPIGQGMIDVQLLVIDRDDPTKQCAVGEQGELYIRAGGLAEGYLGNDDKTANLNKAKFVSNWFVGPVERVEGNRVDNGRTTLSTHEPWMEKFKGPRDRLYRTGDLGRRRMDGNVECFGRIDSQVRFKGFKIDLGEISSHLSQYPFVRESVTIIRQHKDEDPMLVSYFVPETNQWLQSLKDHEDGHSIKQKALDESIGMFKRFESLAEECKKYLSTQVPHYAVPSTFIPLARMPLNPNGKVDKPSLPPPGSLDLNVSRKRRASSPITRVMNSVSNGHNVGYDVKHHGYTTAKRILREPVSKRHLDRTAI